MAEYEQLAERLGCANTAELRSADEVGGIYKDESRVELLCIITNVRKKITKNNTTMAFVTAEDVFGSIEVIVFPKYMSSRRSSLQRAISFSFTAD